MTYSRPCGQAQQSMHVKLPFQFLKNGLQNHHFALDSLFLILYIDRKPRVSSLRCYAAYNLLSCFKVTSSLTTQSQQNLAKNVLPILLFISCLTCHDPRFSNSCMDLYKQHIVESRDYWLFISVKIM